MTPERLEELRQIAGGIGNTPKSEWMDELIVEIDRLWDALPKTRDGVACVPRDVVYYPETDGSCPPLTVDSFAEWTEDDDYEDDFDDDDASPEQPTGFVAWAMSCRGMGRNVTDCYSTLDAMKKNTPNP